MQGSPLDKETFLLFDSLHVSTQTAHHQVMLEEYINGDGIHVNCYASIKCCWSNLGQVPLNTIYSIVSFFFNKIGTMQGEDRYKMLFLDVSGSWLDVAQIFSIFTELQELCRIKEKPKDLTTIRPTPQNIQ
jgi:hypothetical protein